MTLFNDAVSHYYYFDPYAGDTYYKVKKHSIVFDAQNPQKRIMIFVYEDNTDGALFALHQDDAEKKAPSGHSYLLSEQEYKRMHQEEMHDK